MKTQTAVYLALLAGIASCSPSPSPIITTTSGQVQGFSPASHVQAFLGIPYAQPPLGPLRFLAPQPISTPLPGILDATQPAKGCIQVRSAVFPWPYDSNVTAGESEDCLTVDIWRNTKGLNGNKLKPVLIWIHGGGFTEGASSLNLFNPTDFIQNQKDVIVVSINHRLSIWGFPETPAVPPSQNNPGLRDQRLAIEWTQANIQAFGGDPNRITLSGQSAGAYAVWNYLHTYRSNPIVKAAIALSGTPGVASLAPPGEFGEFQRVARAVGCAQTDAEEQLDCLRSVDPWDIRTAISEKELIISGVDGNGGYPNFDGQTYLTTAQVEAAWNAGEFAKIPILAGITHNEADIIGPDPAFSDLMTCQIFDLPLSAQLDLYQGHNVPVYRYRFMGNFPELTPPGFSYMRAYHTADVAILFGSYKTYAPGVASAEAQKASKYLQKAWATFVKNPETGLADLGWKTIEHPTKNLVELFNRKPNGKIQNIRLSDQGVRDAQCQALLAPPAV